MTELAPRTVLVHPDSETLAAATAARLITKLIDTQSVKAPVHLVLTGGTVGIQTLAEVAKSPAAQAVDWSNVHIWWGDERFLPAGDADRNETQAREALLDSLSPALPAENIHAVAPLDEDTPSALVAAEKYTQELANFASPGQSLPTFDVLLLGMGPDGHVASLFPGLPGPGVEDEVVIGLDDSPKPPAARVSLTVPTIQSADEVWVVASGSEKAPAVTRSLNNDGSLPASAALGTKRSLWLLDVTAASAENAV